ncbi:MAG: LysE family translocator [Proteobacteria bacterium]|nr:LysE family translocator [Pseudomonadota bacterium]
MIDQIVVISGITFLVMIVPGPDMVIVMRSTLIGGRAAGLKSSLGVLTGNLVHIAYCAAGIGWLISESILAFSILKYAGAAYLIYLGLAGIFSKTQSLRVDEAARAPSGRTWFLQGFLNNILNVKGSLFYLGVFTMVITPQTSTGTTLLLIAIMMTISAAFWLVFVCTLDNIAVRRFLVRGQRAVNCVFGGVLIFLGVRVALAAR